MSYADLNFNLSLIWPEFFMFVVIMLLFGAVIVEKKYPAFIKAVVNTLPIISLALTVAAFFATMAEGQMFFKAYKIDGLSQFFKLLVAGGLTVCLFNAVKHPTLEEGDRPDYYLFLFLSAWGLAFLASANELVTIYLAMELASYSLYVLIPLRANSREAAEAGMKYILFGAAATALAIFGLSFVIATQHTTYLADLAGCDWSFAQNPMAVVGLVLFLSGMFYKLALFPFHFWCPDVYQGASNETAAYVATLPKLGAVVVLIRVGALLNPGLELVTILAVLSAASMTFGNLCALAQRDLKRMLGFSSVAHAGYIIVGLVPGTDKGLAAAAFYAMAYVLMNLLCFWIISRISQDGRNLTYNDLNGLSKRSPILAICLTIAAISLVGLPPSVGFVGKLWLITAAWGHGYDWLVIVLCVNSALAIYYYLSLVRHAYTEGPEDLAKLTGPAPDNSPHGLAGAAVLAALVVILGVVPGPILDWVLLYTGQLLP